MMNVVTSGHSFICNAAWLYFFILYGLVIIFLLLILEAGPVDNLHQFRQHKNTQIYATQQHVHLPS